MQLGIVMIANIFPGLLMVYYSLKDSLLKLDPASQVSNKSLAMSLWQIFLVKNRLGIYRSAFIYFISGAWHLVVN